MKITPENNSQIANEIKEENNLEACIIITVDKVGTAYGVSEINGNISVPLVLSLVNFSSSLLDKIRDAANEENKRNAN